MSDERSAKVTECWTEETADGRPHIDVEHQAYSWNRDAILMWKEDYEQLKAKADAAEFVESVNRSLQRRGDVYFEK